MITDIFILGYKGWCCYTCIGLLSFLYGLPCLVEVYLVTFDQVCTSWGGLLILLMFLLSINTFVCF